MNNFFSLFNQRKLLTFVFAIIIGLLTVIVPFTMRVSAVSDKSVYYGGDILTMAGELPTYVEAIVVQEGKIKYLGSI